METRIYLDHAAATPVTADARAAIAEGLALWANPSSAHGEGRTARRSLEEARGRIAKALGWTGELLFTSGATEALAAAIGRARADRVLVGATEHDAVMRAGAGAAMLPVDGGGRLRLDALAAALADGPPALVCLQWCNSETGVIQPVAEAGAIIHAAGGLLLLDAAQMPAGADQATLAAADFAAVSAHKRGGPPGIGALLVRDLQTLSPTGGQERGYRPGTENMPAVLGYAAALAEAEPGHGERRARLDDAVRRSSGVVVADDSPRHAAIASYRMPGVGQAAQLIRLDLAGFAVSAGSACASGSAKPSHALAAMGWPEEEGREVIRVSFGRTTTDSDVDSFIAAWRSVARATSRFAA